MSISVRSKRPMSAGICRSSVSPERSGISSPAQLLSKDSKGLQDQLRTLRKNYTRTSEKNGSLRDALKLCRRCLQERDRQLDVANRMISKLSLHREALENTISEDKNSIRKLEASVTKAYGNVPGSFRTQNREIAQLSERVQTAEATAHAANAVVDKYEREVFMLRAALDIHAHEFRDGSGETVHASLVLALGQAREENGQLGAQLVEARMRSSHTEGAIDKLRTEQAWLLEQKRTAETGILHLQTTGVDMSSKLDMLQKKHQSILDDLAFERDRVKDLENRGNHFLCQSQRLQQKVVELQNSLNTANSGADTRCRSVSAQMQMQLDSLTAEHQSVQNSLNSQIMSLQQHIDSTTQQLQLAHSKLEEEKAARAEDAHSSRVELEKQQEHAAVAEMKTESDGNVLKGQERELQVLHHQIDDLTGINQQLQLELHEAVATGEQLKQEIFSYVQRMAVKDHETEHVVKVAENATATLQKEYGLVMKENNTLKEHVRRLQTDLSTTMDRTDALLKERQNLQQRLHHEGDKVAHTTEPEHYGSLHMSKAALGPVREQGLSTLNPVRDSIAHVKEISQRTPSNPDASDVHMQPVQIAAHRCSHNTGTQHTAMQERARELPAPASTQSVSHTAAGQKSRSENWGSSLTAADLEHESGTRSTDQRRCHEVVEEEATSQSAAALLPGTVFQHCNTSSGVQHTSEYCHGAAEHRSRRTSGSQPAVSGNQFDAASPCLSNSMSHNMQSTLLPKTTSLLNTQDEIGSSAGPIHTLHCHKLLPGQHRRQEARTGPFPGFSQPGAASSQDNTSGRRASGELSCWEKRLKSAQEKLQLMRLEREQWYDMASAADSARKQHHPGEAPRTLYQARFSHATGPADYGGSMSAPLNCNGDWEPVEARSSAHSMAGAGHHRHRKLQDPQESVSAEARPSSAGDQAGTRQLVPHAPQDCRSLPKTGASSKQHGYTGTMLEERTRHPNGPDGSSRRSSFDPGRDDDWAGPMHAHRLAGQSNGPDQQEVEFSNTSAGVLPTFRTPKLEPVSGRNPASHRDSGVTQHSHGTWVADSIRQSVTGALDQAMEALEAELARKLPGRVQSDKHTLRSGEGVVRRIAPEATEAQEPSPSHIESQLDDIARMQVNEFGSGCGDL